MRNRNLSHSLSYQGKENEFFMQVGFEELERVLFSISYRRFNNRESGVVRIPDCPEGYRRIRGLELRGAFSENKEDARIYHRDINWHINHLKLDDKKDFFLVSNGNLGNNFWNLSWEYDKNPQLYCLEGEEFTKRVYSCFVVPKIGNPKIESVKFNELEEILDETGNNISNEVNWCNYGQMIVRESNVVPIEEIIEEFCDIRHIFDLDNRKEDDKKVLGEFYIDYTQRFKEKMLRELESRRKRGEHYHSTLGIMDSGITIFHSKDVVENIAKKLIDRGIKDAIVLDNGGSVGLYASWLNDNNGGWLNTCSYFRPERISYIGVVLK